MRNNSLPRLDERSDVRALLLPHCRLGPGDVWTDPISGHKVGCLDAARPHDIAKIMDGHSAALAIHDPPYNLVAFKERAICEFTDWCKQWVQNTLDAMDSNASLYVW